MGPGGGNCAAARTKSKPNNSIILCVLHSQEQSSSINLAMSVFGKLSQGSKPKPFRVMVLGLTGVGKTALTVRFVTGRYIGEYDPTLEKTYTFHTVIDNGAVLFEILDSAGQSQDAESFQLEDNMRWAEAFVLMYSVTDKCSFDDCNRLKFLINYNKRRRRLSPAFRDALPDAPVVLVGNKCDQIDDRMVKQVEGSKRAKDIGCVAFHEISVRESGDQVRLVFQEVYRAWRRSIKMAMLKRSTSDLHHGPIDLNTLRFISAVKAVPTPCSPTGGPPTVMVALAAAACASSTGNNSDHHAQGATSSTPKVPCSMPAVLGRPWIDRLLESQFRNSVDDSSNGRFRDRASTDSSLHSPRKVTYDNVRRSACTSPLLERRMSISMRGSNF